MKTILSIAAFVAASFVIGCETDPSTSGTSVSNLDPMRSAAQSSPDPAITFKTTATSKGKTYDAIGVIDSGGGNLATIYTASATTTRVKYPKWSPAADRIAFVQYDEQNNGTYHQNIYLRDISVSHGNVSGSNTRSIYAPSGFESLTAGIGWSPVTSANKIAFTTYDRSTNGNGKVQIVAATGGTPSVLYSSDPNEYHIYLSLDYSPDGSKIAFIDHLNSASAPNPEIIQIVDASSGTLLESIAIGSPRGACHIAWSRSGTNQIAFTADLTDNGTSDPKLYYVAPISGSTPSTNDVVGIYPTWSPNNSSVVTAQANSTSLQKIVTGTATTSTISTGASSALSHPDWKR